MHIVHKPISVRCVYTFGSCFTRVVCVLEREGGEGEGERKKGREGGGGRESMSIEILWSPGQGQKCECCNVNTLRQRKLCWTPAVTCTSLSLYMYISSRDLRKLGSYCVCHSICALCTAVKPS